MIVCRNCIRRFKKHNLFRVVIPKPNQFFNFPNSRAWELYFALRNAWDIYVTGLADVALEHDFTVNHKGIPKFQCLKYTGRKTCLNQFRVVGAAKQFIL
jgi:hypothetical protein